MNQMVLAIGLGEHILQFLCISIKLVCGTMGACVHVSVFAWEGAPAGACVSITSCLLNRETSSYYSDQVGRKLQDLH